MESIFVDGNLMCYQNRKEEPPEPDIVPMIKFQFEFKIQLHKPVWL